MGKARSELSNVHRFYGKVLVLRMGTLLEVGRGMSDV
jgi:hypothetical protein